MKKELEALSVLLQNDIDNNKLTLNKNQLDFYRYHEYFDNLDLTDNEIYKNLISLKKIIEQNDECAKLNGKCVNSFNMHLGLRRYNNHIDAYYYPCSKMQKIIDETKYKKNYLYNYYQGSEVSEVKLKSKDIGATTSPSKNNAIKLFLSKFNNKENTGMYLYGKCGVGKTFLSFAFANSYAEIANKKISFVYIPEFVNIIKSGFNNPIDKEKGITITEYAKNCDVLVLDDLGAEHATDWFYSNYLLNILNIRAAMQKITIFSSNYSIEQLRGLIIKRCKADDKEIICDRIIDRIKVLVNNDFVHVDGKNMREK